MLIALAAAALAAAAPAPVEGIALFDPATVERFVENARNHIRLAKLPDGTPLPRETPEERARPILPDGVAKRALDRGMISGTAELCGGDWRQMSFAPLVDSLRNQGLTPRQIAFATLLHDTARPLAADFLTDGCTADVKAGLLAMLAAERKRG